MEQNISKDTLYIINNYPYMMINPFNPTDRFSLIQNNDWKSPLKLLNVERVKAEMLDLILYSDI